jgi:cytochrome oxidase Cu insertion factor (SCO1/SenC/PrrC family)
MCKCLRSFLVGGLLLLALQVAPLSNTVSGQTGPESLKLKVGEEAPDFTLRYFDGNNLKEVHLSDYRGKKNVVLAFYIFAFTGG